MSVLLIFQQQQKIVLSQVFHTYADLKAKNISTVSCMWALRSIYFKNSKYLLGQKP